MKSRLVAALFVMLFAGACERAGKLVDKVKTVVGQDTAGEIHDQVDPALDALVNRTAEGTIFRKDVPFPSPLGVRVTKTSYSDGSKVLVRSELGAQASVQSGTETLTSFFRIAGGYMRLNLEMAQFEKPVDPGEKGTVAKIISYPLAGRTVDFRRESGGWVVDGARGPAAKVWAEELAPGMKSLLVDNGVQPRMYWFGERRFKLGDVVPLSGESLAILFGERCSGSVTLTLESFRAYDGHPCGVFVIRGAYKRRDYMRPDGEVTDEDVTIESGKVWLSLIYPLVVKEEMQTIETRVSKDDAGAPTRSQGAYTRTVVRQWVKEQ